MSSEERIDRIERVLEHHIEFVGASLTRVERQIEELVSAGRETDRRLGELAQQVNRTAAAQEQTEEHLQKLIGRVDEHGERLDKLDGGKR